MSLVSVKDKGIPEKRCNMNSINIPVNPAATATAYGTYPEHLRKLMRSHI
jgi:hypothetical protein